LGDKIPQCNLFISILQLVEYMAEKSKDIEKYFEKLKCTICGVVVSPHHQGNTSLPKEEHLAKEHSDLE
jgi:hypothetical protein